MMIALSAENNTDDFIRRVLDDFAQLHVFAGVYLPAVVVVVVHIIAVRTH